MKRLLGSLVAFVLRFHTVCPRCANGGRVATDWIGGHDVCVDCGWESDR